LRLRPDHTEAKTRHPGGQAKSRPIHIKTLSKCHDGLRRILTETKMN